MMRTHVSTLAAAALLTLAQAAWAADEPYTSQPQAEKPGRAADEDGSTTVKSGRATDRPGRAAEEEGSSAMSERDGTSRDADDSTVKSGGKTQKPGREADEGKNK
jgi:hypothetical protein